jgi:hypothetical protein
VGGTFGPRGALDPSKGTIILCTGKKGSGKSKMGLLHFRGYPGDRVVIDVAGDDGPMGPDVIDLSGTVADLPSRWPEHLRKDDKRPMTLRYVPDAGSPTFLEDMDRITGLVMAHGDCALLVHEIGRAAPAGQTPPHMRALLQHNRHRRVTAIFCGPRPQTIDPLVLGQADLVYVFETRVARDRQRIAETVGWNVRDFSDALDELGPHEYLRYDANEAPPAPGDKDLRLVHLDALPADVVAEVTRWSLGDTQGQEPGTPLHARSGTPARAR